MITKFYQSISRRGARLILPASADVKDLRHLPLEKREQIEGMGPWHELFEKHLNNTGHNDVEEGIKLLVECNGFHIMVNEVNFPTVDEAIARQ